MQSTSFQSTIRKAGQLEPSGRGLRVSNKISRIDIDGRTSVYDEMFDKQNTIRQRRNQDNDYDRVRHRKSSYMSSSNSSPYPHERHDNVSPRHSIDSQLDSPRSRSIPQRMSQHRDSDISTIDLPNQSRKPSNAMNSKSRSPTRYHLKDASNNYENSSPSSQKSRDNRISSNKELVHLPEANFKLKSKRVDAKFNQNNSQQEDTAETAFVISEMKLNKRGSTEKSVDINQDKEIEVHPESQKEPIETVDRKEKYKNSDYIKLAKRSILDYIQTPAPAEFMIKCKIIVEKGMFNNYLFYLENYRGDNEDLLLMSTKRKKASTSLHFRIEAFESASIGAGGHFIEFGKVASNFSRSSYTLIGNMDNENDENIDRSNSNLRSSSRAESRMSDKRNASSKKYFDLEYNNKLVGHTKPKDINLELLVNDSHSDTTNTSASLIESTFKREKSKRITLVTKKPEYDPATKKYKLDFGGRARLASCNNMQIIDNSNSSKVLFQLGKVKSKFYYCDYTYPFTAFQAFGLAISCLSRG
jgi:hypothetical protein